MAADREIKLKSAYRVASDQYSLLVLKLAALGLALPLAEYAALHRQVELARHKVETARLAIMAYRAAEL